MTYLPSTIHSRYADEKVAPPRQRAKVLHSRLVIVSAAALMLMGVVMVFSATSQLKLYAPEQLKQSVFEDDQGGMHVFSPVNTLSESTSADDGWVSAVHWIRNSLGSTARRQMFFAFLALVAMGFMYRWGGCWMGLRADPDSAVVDAVEGPRGRRFYRVGVWLMLLTIICLLATLVPGIGLERNAARRWLSLKFAQYEIGFQPSELAKIATVVLLAAWLPRRFSKMPRFWTGMVPPVILLGAIVGLIVFEDLGTAALIALVGGLMVLSAGGRLLHALLLAPWGIACFVLMIWIEPYRLERLMSYRDIWADPLGGGYHAIQSLLGIAAGGLSGVGLGGGMQKYGYLPEAQNDFIFSMICEELGMLGGLAVMALFVCLVFAGWRLMMTARSSQARLLAMGITLMIGLQAVMNIAVVTVSIPTKGISLPFVSAGGSGLIFYAIGTGLLASVGRLPSGEQSSNLSAHS